VRLPRTCQRRAWDRKPSTGGDTWLTLSCSCRQDYVDFIAGVAKRTVGRTLMEASSDVLGLRR
jgi:hypothetical protein